MREWSQQPASSEERGCFVGHSQPGKSPAIGLDIPDLATELQTLLRRIPAGRVTTYGDLARAMGDVRAARWVGEFLLDHPHDDACACHRVVRANGELGRYITGEASEKRSLLVNEGLSFSSDRVDLNQCLNADELSSTAPLARLQQFQATVASRVCELPLVNFPSMYCGLDVAYDANGVGYAAAVLLDADSLHTLAEVTCAAPATFPYIPGYLAFRELPFLLQAWEQIRPQAAPGTVCLIDGNGRLHPRRAGIACCFGVLANVPAFGVAKSLLCGRVDKSAATQRIAPVILGAELLGLAMWSEASRHPLYVSIGQALALNDAERIVISTLTEHFLPEPTHRADQLSKRAKRGTTG